MQIELVKPMFLKEEPLNFALLAVSWRKTSKLSNGSSSLVDNFRRLLLGIASRPSFASSRRRAFDMSAASSSLSAITKSHSAQSARLQLKSSDKLFFADRHEKVARDLPHTKLHSKKCHSPAGLRRNQSSFLVNGSSIGVKLSGDIPSDPRCMSISPRWFSTLQRHSNIQISSATQPDTSMTVMRKKKIPQTMSNLCFSLLEQSPLPSLPFYPLSTPSSRTE